MLRFRLLLVSCFVLAACSDITGLDGVVITVAVSPDRIVPGDTAAIVVRFTNPTFGTIEVPDHHCVSPFEIANASDEVVVGNEPVICTLEIRGPIVIGPFESIERRVAWNGRRTRFLNGVWVTEAVPAGLYRVYGRLAGRRSAPDTIEVAAP